MTDTTPTIRHDLEALLLRALDVSYISTSCKDSVETGNHYQSLRLSTITTTGFRESRGAYLDQIDFTNRRVLDLGSNLGELSRAARRRGAELVDGFEYDEFFLELARAVNALLGTTRVSFFRRDITDPTSFDERYDIILAFSVWHYVGPLVPLVATITNDLLVVETHKLEGNLQTHYIAPVQPYFPVYKVLGYSKWRDGAVDGDRAVIAFARSEAQLSRCLTTFLAE